MEIDTNEGILIVMNVHRVLKPLEVVLSVAKGRHAIRTMLGWTPWATRRKTWWYSCHQSAVTITGPQQVAQQKSCNGNSRLMPKIITFVSVVWCIPHHGAFHPKKKARSGLFFAWRGHKLHKLLQCPQLMDLSPLLGLGELVFNVGFCGHVSEVFFQCEFSVWVPEKGADWLRFLCWPNGNFNHKMVVHLVGATAVLNLHSRSV